MSVNPGLLPNNSAPIDDQGGLATQEWRDFFLLLADGAETTDLSDQYTALAARVTALENSNGDLATFVSGLGISIIGQIHDDIIRISLAANLGDLLNVDDVTVPPVENDALTFNATSGKWEPRASANAIYMPLVTGEIYAGQPRFMYFDDGSLMSVQVE